jgi:hypothetical protein
MVKKLEYLWNYANSYEFMERTQNGLPPVIICLACNGGVQGKEYNENLPETVDEIATKLTKLGHRWYIFMLGILKTSQAVPAQQRFGTRRTKRFESGVRISSSITLQEEVWI